jgi:hypothetical protein
MKACYNECGLTKRNAAFHRISCSMFKKKHGSIHELRVFAKNGAGQGSSLLLFVCVSLLCDSERERVCVYEISVFLHFFDSGEKGVFPVATKTFTPMPRSKEK